MFGIARRIRNRTAPIREARLTAPAWLTALPGDHWLGKSVLDSVKAAAERMRCVRDHEVLKRALDENEFVEDALPVRISLNDGTLEYRLNLKDGLFYQVLGEACGEMIDGEAHLFDLMRQLVAAKREYDKVAQAVASARSNGYGMVPPTMDELTLQPPELVKQGPNTSVRLKARAPSLQIVRADIETPGPRASPRRWRRPWRSRWRRGTRPCGRRRSSARPWAIWCGRA